MIFSLMMLLAIKPITNKTACQWPIELIDVDLENEIHFGVLARAAKQCSVLYPLTSPCLVKLKRTEGISFYAYCGEGLASPDPFHGVGK